MLIGAVERFTASNVSVLAYSMGSPIARKVGDWRGLVEGQVDCLFVGGRLKGG